MIEQDYLFVYGTLLPEFKNEMSEFLARQAQFVSGGSFQGRLYEVDGYPGAVLSGSPLERVFGSVFDISSSEQLFKVLDTYEECREGDPKPHLYRREKVRIDCADGQDVLAWTYIYNLGLENLLLIPSGDYLFFRQL